MSTGIYVYQAIRRTKENNEIVGPKAVREVCYEGRTEEDTINKLKLTISQHPGVWRIYRSVNRRDERKAKLELITCLTKQLVYPNQVSPKSPNSLWKDILMQPHNKAERLYLLDIDTKDKTQVLAIMSSSQLCIVTTQETINGFHVVVEPCDPTIFASYDYVEVKKDALLFIEAVEVTG